ncbi:hypothetical protein [Bradyrhizobium sp.]|uniref:hypothetical protein n=1 Tax=Bradyrhizobium sp. TaxID=376 RepID=UPI004037E7B0
MRTPLQLALAVLAILAGPSAAPAQDEIDKTRADAFDKRLFARPLAAKMTFACFVRAYDAEHLAKHPQQKVAAMKLLVTAENVPDDKTVNYAFRLGFKYRHRSGNFDSSGSCNHFTPEDAGDEIRLGCGVDCDGGGLNVAVSGDAKSAIIRLTRIRIWQNAKPDDDAEHSLVAGADDGIFRLERADNKACAALVTDSKELAALRRK